MDAKAGPAWPTEGMAWSTGNVMLGGERRLDLAGNRALTRPSHHATRPLQGLHETVARAVADLNLSGGFFMDYRMAA